MSSGPRLLLFTTGRSPVLDELLGAGHRLCGIVQSVAAPRGPERGRSLPGRLARALDARVRSAPTLREVASRHRLPYYCMDRRNDRALPTWVGERRPDLIVVCGMYRLLGRDVFSIPRLGAINVHPALLPRHRGPDPIFWTYYGMDPESGVTVHLVDEGADTGDILLQESFPVPAGMPRRDLLAAGMGRSAPRLVVQAVEALDRGTASRIPQPAGSPTAPARRVALSEYRDLIGWETWPIERLWHVLRGLAWLHGVAPPPGWRASLGWEVGGYVREPGPGSPGSVGRDGQGHFVAHREGRIRLSVRYSARGVLKALLGRFL